METCWSGQAFAGGEKRDINSPRCLYKSLCGRVDAQPQEKPVFFHAYSLCFLNSALHFLL